MSVRGAGAGAGSGYEYVTAACAAGIGAAGGAVVMQSPKSEKHQYPCSALVVLAITPVTRSGLHTPLLPDLVHNRMRCTIKVVVYPG